MPNQYREVVTRSRGSGFFGSFLAVLIGLFLFLVSFPLMWWNEGRSVDRIRTLEQGRGLVLSVASDTIDVANNDALIHVSGTAVTDEILKDTTFGIEENAIKLKRSGEMYQWKENEETKKTQNLGGTETWETIYTYEKVWADDLIFSSRFKIPEGHENPSTMPYRNRVFSATDVKLGKFELPRLFVQKINDFSQYSLSYSNLEAMEADLQQSFALNGNELFSGDPDNPQIGSMRIRYEIIRTLDVSIVGK